MKLHHKFSIERSLNLMCCRGLLNKNMYKVMLQLNDPLQKVI